MSAATARKIWTREEYLEMERAAEEKHELHDGEIFAMSGASLRHNRIAANLITTLNNTLRERSCEVLTSDMRVRIPGGARYTYPDALVVCGGAELEDNHQDTLLNPHALFEILSPSTETYDRGLKFSYYRLIPTLDDYVLVSQDEPRIEHYVRQGGDGWLLRELGRGQTLLLASAGCELAVDAIYFRVFDQPGGAR